MSTGQRIFWATGAVIMLLVGKTVYRKRFISSVAWTQPATCPGPIESPQAAAACLSSHQWFGRERAVNPDVQIVPAHLETGAEGKMHDSPTPKSIPVWKYKDTAVGHDGKIYRATTLE